MMALGYVFFFFFFIDPATTEISPLPLHAALPILGFLPPLAYLAIPLCLWGCLRISEVIRLEIGHLVLDDGAPRLYVSRSKGGKSRVVGLSHKIGRAHV